MPRFVTIARIGGMRTVHCARAVYTALAAVPGVSTAEVVVGRATIEHDGGASETLLREAVALAGYELIETDVRRSRGLRVVEE